MRDIDEGDAEALVHLFELDLHLLPHFEVEGAEGLVEEQNFGLVDDGAGDGDALLLPAREGGDGALFKAFQIDERERLFHLLRDLLFGELFLLRIPLALVVFVSIHDLLAAQPEGDVFEHVEVGEEGIALEHRIDGALVGGEQGNILAVEQNLPARGEVEARDHAQRRRLSAARGAEEGDELTLVDVKADIVDDEGVVVILDDVLEFDDVFCHFFSLLSLIMNALCSPLYYI